MKPRVWVLASCALVLAAFEAGFLFYQRTAQEQLISRLVDPGAISSSVLITREPLESGIFSQRDRLTVKFGSSAIGGDADDAPLTVQMDVEARFGLLGLSGTVVPRASTRSARKLLALVQGDRPELRISYELHPVTKALQLELDADPFDVRVETPDPLISTAWRIQSPDPVRWTLFFDTKTSGRSVLRAGTMKVSFDDGTGGSMTAENKGLEIRHEFRLRVKDADREWYAERAASHAEAVGFRVRDHRGELSATLEGVRTKARRRHVDSPDVLNGDYELEAARLAFRIAPEGAAEEAFDAEKLRLRLHGDNVPLGLFEPIDDVALEHLLKKAESVRLRLDELSLVSDGLPAMAKGHLTAHLGHHPDRSREACQEFEDEDFNVGWSLEVELPDQLIDSVTALAGGRIRGFDPVDFMVPAERHGAPYHVLDFRGDLKRGAQLNGLPAGF